ncbi:hypothetical protein [Bdellovibrio sp. HCB-110]|uniref:hypothetical protein n=1 Tax=Bdellovibrio sp. HCB-110 TaxID=3391182 RepID=UPI0039B52E12
MKTVKLIGSIALMSILSACAGGKDSDKNKNAGVQTNGTCSQELVDVSNNLINSIEAFQQAYLHNPNNQEELASRAQASVEACRKMFPRYEGVTCKAEFRGKVVELKTNEIKEYCVAIEEVAARRSRTAQ